MIVEEYKIGNTTIKIYDDAYINKTPAEIEQVKKDLTASCWLAVLSARAAGKKI